MSETLGASGTITRRTFVRDTVATAVGVGSVLAGGDAAARALTARGPGLRARSHRPGVAIIGAGTGGVAAAYFLAGTHDVDLFEARAKVGGHCDTRWIDYRGRRIAVDIGAQFFHPDTHPVYVTLLRQVGLYDPAHPAADDTLRARASLCIFETSGGTPVFSSSHALATPQVALEFATFTRLARQAVLSGLRWETTVEAWVSGLSLSHSFKEAVLYPWIMALIGSPRADALRASARSILETFALAFPADLTQPATTYNSTIGLQGNLQRLLDRSPGVRLHLAAPVHALERSGSRWCVQTPGGRHGPYASVVINAPARVGHQLLRRLPTFSALAELLDSYEYFDSRLLIHTDPAYVARARDDWASYNAGILGAQCEGSVWYGALHHALPSGRTIDVFKSWATRRRADPVHILFERRFQHPIINRAAIQAARALQAHQGRHGLYFSGQYTTGFDAQESAVYSAIQVAARLAPASHTLESLRARLHANGLAGISYHL
jgi:predicted NAD/FAD-binding protein